MQSGVYFQHEAQSSSPKAQSSSPIYIYADSFAVFKGFMEWLAFWEQNGWEVNQTPVWQKDKWQDILGTAKQGNFAIASAIAEALGSFCGIISKIKVLHLKIKVYMKNVAVFTH